MSDQQEQPNGSKIFNLSIRGLITLILVTGVIGVWITNTVLMSLGWTSANTEVPEPIYSLVIAAVSYYFGTTTKK